jgi:putative IMPACT (imprinted ancient) family translation regulator
MPNTLATPVHSELIIKKSRFIGCVEPMRDRAAAQARVIELWRQHPGATHVCWALLAGGQSAAVDDGEPSGTAGRPMLEVLRHQDLEGVLATVVRYYGGINLGAGGLVRAYTDAVAQALLGATQVAIESSGVLPPAYPAHAQIKRRNRDLRRSCLIRRRVGLRRAVAGGRWSSRALRVPCADVARSPLRPGCRRARRCCPSKSAAPCRSG